MKDEQAILARLKDLCLQSLRCKNLDGRTAQGRQWIGYDAAIRALLWVLDLPTPEDILARAEGRV